MTVTELIEYGLGRSPEAIEDLDLDAPLGLLDALAGRTGLDRRRLQEMTLAGWMPVSAEDLEAQPGAFEAYVRRHSVLLNASKRSTRPLRNIGTKSHAKDQAARIAAVDEPPP